MNDHYYVIKIIEYTFLERAFCPIFIYAYKSFALITNGLKMNGIHWFMNGYSMNGILSSLKVNLHDL